MGLLNDFAVKGLGLLGAKTSTGKLKPSYRGQDFAQGLIITEIINGEEASEGSTGVIKLVGRFAPHQPFEFGGEQRIVREEYPGSSEPTVHVLGPKEGPITIKGRMKTNKFRGADGDLTTLRQAAQEYQELIDAMRIRGNLVFIQLGDWYRYGFIEKSNFRLYTLQDIEYDITFDIVGFNKPNGWRVVISKDIEIIKPSKDVTNAAAAALAAAQNIPSSMPLSAADIINNAINDIAGAIKQVTDFTNGILDDAEKIVGAANRAIGLIKNARATISKSKRRISSISNTANGLAGSASSEFKKAIATIQNTDHVAKTIGNFSSLSILLATLQSRYSAMSKQVPFRRHLVKTGDTLNNISMKYYGISDNWKKIYDHNKLSDTVLVIGSILEIPKA